MMVFFIRTRVNNCENLSTLLYYLKDTRIMVHHFVSSMHQHTILNKLPLRKQNEQGWPSAWTRMYDAIVSMAKTFETSGEVESLAERLYDLVNSDWSEEDSAKVCRRLEADVRFLQTELAAQKPKMQLSEREV